MSEYDVIVIGAGFAGVTASREMSNRGHKTLLLEARDRIGGRTWYDRRLGREIEMGGTYVHWNQPHMWAELTRYGIELKRSPDTDKQYLIVDGKTISGPQDEMTEKLMEVMEVFLADAKTNGHFERPFDPYYNPSDLEGIDHLSVQDRLDEIAPQLTAEQNALLDSLWNSYTCTPHLDQPGLAHAYRWAALTGHCMPEFQETFERYSMKTGTKSLINAIFGDSKAELKLSTPVESVTKAAGNRYQVKTRAGAEYSAKAVIVAVPVNVLNDIRFEPALAPEAHAFSEEKQSSQGTKWWVVARGVGGTATFLAPKEYPLNMAITEVVTSDGDALICGFGSDANIDLNDPKVMQEQLRHWIPEIEVLDCAGHNWVKDEFSKGTWGVIKKNQLSRYGQAVKQPQGGLFLAGSDFANGWAGYMDGAIETGLTTSRQAHEYLNAQKTVFNVDATTSQRAVV